MSWADKSAKGGTLLFTSTVPTNSGEYAGQDLPDEAADEAADGAAAESDQAEAVETNASPLQRSQEAIDEGWDAAREALKDTLPDDEVDEKANSSRSEQDTGPVAEDSP
jgi:hypothetical protein